MLFFFSLEVAGNFPGCQQGRCYGYMVGGLLIVLVNYPGALDGGPQCCMSILRNNNVPCRYICNYPADSKIVICRMSILRKSPCRVTNFISHVTRLHVAC